MSVLASQGDSDVQRSVDMLVCSPVSAGLQSFFIQVLSRVQGSAEMHKGKGQGLLAGQGEVEEP